MNRHDTPPAEGSSAPPLLASNAPLITLDTRSLFDGQRELRIVHKGETYRLRITRQDKLILTK
jgi:hemin uptake protein HemP